MCVVGFYSPQRVLKPGDPWCFDDWCLTVDQVKRIPPSTYDISLRISSRARRVSQRAQGAWVCLIDQQGNCYTPQFDPKAIPLDSLLKPENPSVLRAFSISHQVFRQSGLEPGTVTGSVLTSSLETTPRYFTGAPTSPFNSNSSDLAASATA